MNKKALLVLTVGLLTMSIASCGTRKPSESSVMPSSIEPTPSSEPVSTSSEEPASSEPQKSSEPTPSSEKASSSEAAPSSVPVSSSEALPSSSTAPISSSEASISSSEEQSSSEEDIPGASEPVDVVVNMSSYADSSKTYALTFTFKRSFFDLDSNYFFKDLAMYCFGMAIANQNKTMMKSFYEDSGFDTIYLSETYDRTPTETSIGYAFAHLKVGRHDYVFVSIRGFNYGKEWADNCNVGLTGEHNGFANRANEVQEALESYVSTNEFKNVELLITGYSRGGAVANLLAKRMDDLVDNEENDYDYLYAYTFEAPKGALITTNNDSYKNIINVISSGDPVTHIVPEEYGFTRYGQDFDIYTDDIDAAVAAFDSTLEFPAFSATANYTNDIELIDFLIDGILSYEEDASNPDSSKQAKTREEFVNNYQETISYGMGLYFSIDSATLNKIKTGFDGLGTWEKFMIMQPDGLYNFVRQYFDADGVEYDEDELKGHCNNATSFLQGPGLRALIPAMDENKPLNRAILLHTPEINYALLNAYEEVE